MSEWLTRIIDHPVKQRLEQLQNILSETTITPEDPSEAITDLERLKRVAEFIRISVNQTDPFLVTPPILNPLDNPIQSIITEVTRFCSDRNRAHLVNANNHADTLLVHVSKLPLIPGDIGLETAQADVNSFRLNIKDFLSDLDIERKKLKDRLSGLDKRIEETSTEISAQKGRLDTAIAEYQQQFSQAENARRDQFTEAQNTRSQMLEQVTIEFKTKLQESLDDSKTRLTSHISNSESQLKELASSLDLNAKTTLKTLKEYRDKAQNLIHVIGSTGMAGEYQKVADKARKFSIVWQFIAVGAMIFLIIFAILTFLATQVTEIRWGSVGARVFVAITFGILAAYGARQADRYFNNEFRNRRFQLELSSIDPYLVGLPQDTQQQVKVELAQRLFGNAGLSLPSEAKEITGTSLDLVKMFLKMLPEIIKKAR